MVTYEEIVSRNIPLALYLAGTNTYAVLAGLYKIEGVMIAVDIFWDDSEGSAGGSPRARLFDLDGETYKIAKLPDDGKEDWEAWMTHVRGKGHGNSYEYTREAAVYFWQNQGSPSSL